MRLFKPNPATADLRLLAVDIETTGLKPGRDSILSIGWVPVNGTVIDLSGAQYFVIANDADVTSSVSIHGLTDDTLATGTPLATVLDAFTEALEDRVLLAHYASIETGFLRHELGRAFKPEVVDTFALERRHMERMGTYPRGEDLRLPRVRRRYNLPDYPNHNALNDALACAELYLCLIKKYSLGNLSNLQP